jgi:hypothetical protein
MVNNLLCQRPNAHHLVPPYAGRYLGSQGRSLITSTWRQRERLKGTHAALYGAYFLNDQVQPAKLSHAAGHKQWKFLGFPGLERVGVDAPYSFGTLAPRFDVDRIASLLFENESWKIRALDK